MKRALIFAICFWMVAVAFAQEEYRKPTILVAGFKNMGNVGRSEADIVRNTIISSLSKQSRVQLVDLETETTLTTEQKRRLSEATIEDFMANGGEEMSRMVANYIVVGSVSDMTITQKEHKSDKGTTYTYEAKVTYVVKAVSSKNGIIAYSSTLTSSKTKDTRDEARSAALSSAGLGCSFVQYLAPLTGEVYEGDYTEKKGRLLTCYIKLGAMHGVREGDYFDIQKVKYVAGEALYEEVGILKVTDVHNKIAECQVRKKGSEEVLAAMKQYLRDRSLNPEAARPLVVTSRCDGGGGLLNFF